MLYTSPPKGLFRHMFYCSQIYISQTVVQLLLFYLNYPPLAFIQYFDNIKLVSAVLEYKSLKATAS